MQIFFNVNACFQNILHDFMKQWYCEEEDKQSDDTKP